MSNLFSVGQYKSICVLRDRLQVLVGECGGEGGGQFEKKDQNWVKRNSQLGAVGIKLSKCFLVYRSCL